MGAAKRIVILSARVGAGHVRAATALAEAFGEMYPGVEVRHIEALEYTSAAFRKSFIGTYEKLVKHLPSVWELLYEKMEAKPVTSKTKRLSALFSRINSRRMVKEVAAWGPDRVVCTHYFPAEILGARRRKGKLDVPIFVTLTDYDIHVMWIQRGVDRYFVATDEMAYALEAKGIGDAKVSVTGIPIMPVFSKRFPDKRTMRKALGLRPRCPTVLVAAGGMGLAGIDQTVTTLADTADDVQLLAVAGSNEKLAAALAKAAEDRPGKIVPFGFVDNMHELMAASDFAVTKCGGLTSSECMAMGLPMVIVKPIPGQEERNSDFLLASGVGVRANSPAHLQFKVRDLLGDAARRARMRAAARITARPRAAYDIAAEVMRDLD